MWREFSRSAWNYNKRHNFLLLNISSHSIFSFVELFIYLFNFFFLFFLVFFFFIIFKIIIIIIKLNICVLLLDLLCRSTFSRWHFFLLLLFLSDLCCVCWLGTFPDQLHITTHQSTSFAVGFSSSSSSSSLPSFSFPYFCFFFSLFVFPFFRVIIFLGFYSWSCIFLFDLLF